jgi:hypothetical protein
LGKKFYNSLKTGPNFFLQHLKNKIIKKILWLQKKVFIPLFCCSFWIRDPGSDIRDLGPGMGKNQDPGSGMFIPDPQHCKNLAVCCFSRPLGKAFLSFLKCRKWPKH